MILDVVDVRHRLGVPPKGTDAPGALVPTLDPDAVFGHSVGFPAVSLVDRNRVIAVFDCTLVPASAPPVAGLVKSAPGPHLDGLNPRSLVWGSTFLITHSWIAIRHPLAFNLIPSNVNETDRRVDHRRR